MSKHTPGPWKWQGEDYRGGWGWQMLVGPRGEGLIVGQALGGGISPHLKSYQPVAPELCITGMLADGKEHVEPVHVFSEANARLIAAAPETAAERDRLKEINADLLEALKGLEKALLKDARQKTITGDTVEYHLDGNAMYHAINGVRAAIAKAEGRT